MSKQINIQSKLEAMIGSKSANTLYHSQYPQNNSNILNAGQDSHMKLSLLSFDQNSSSEFGKDSSINKKLSYKYKRVGNIFKLVSVEDNEQEKEVRLDKIDQLQNKINSLSAKVMELQGTQRSKSQRMDLIVDAIKQQISWLAERDRETNFNEKNRIILQNQLKERIEEVEQQLSSQENKFSQISQLTTLANLYRGAVEFQTKKIQDLEYQVKKELQSKILSLKSEFEESVSSLSEKISLYQEKLKKRKSFKTHSSDTLTDKIIKIKHIQSYEVRQTKTEYLASQNNYYLDRQGRLLDQNGYRLLNENNQEIVLNPDHLEILKHFKILEEC